MKTFIKVSILVLLATGILLFLLMFSFNFIAKNVINAYGTSITGTKVKIEKVRFAIVGTGHLGSLDIRNPENFTSDSFFKVESISTDIDIKSFFTNTKIINSIIIKKPIIRFELNKNYDSNLDEILKRVMRFSKKIKENTLAEKKINTTSKLVINEFSLNDATLEILVPNTKKIVTLGLSPIYLKDIGSVEGGVLPNELVKIIIERIKKKIINEEINELVNYKKQIEKTKDAINDYKSKTKEKIRNKINEKINNIF